LLNKRDGYGIWKSSIEIQAISDAKVLVMEVPEKW